MTHVLFEDESLRDGLQFEKNIVPLEQKKEIFALLVNSGVKRIQVGSFVNPKVVPQMADTDELISLVQDTRDVVISGLVLNERGLLRAIDSRLPHISLSASASNSHSLKNVRKPSQEAIHSAILLIKEAKNAGIAVRAGVQCAFGCVYEGAIAEEVVIDAILMMTEAGADEINLADTTGMANPDQLTNLVSRAKTAIPDTPLSLHLHDTRGLGIANMVAGYKAGVTIFDTSAGGLGGCPFVKGAAGNVATEDAVNLFEEMGITTGIDLQKICKVHDYYKELLDRELPGRMSKVLKTTFSCE